MEKRVHFYSSDDLSAYFYFERLEYVYNNYIPNRKYDDINDVIELWNCKQLIEKCKFNRCSEDTLNRYRKIAKESVADIALYFKTLDTNAFLSVFKTIGYDYKESVFDIFDKVAKAFLTEDVLKKLLSEDPGLIKTVLHCRNIVMQMSAFITEYLKNYDLTAELLLSRYAEKNYSDEKTLIFPNSFSLKDRETCISDYCDKECANPNYLRLAQFCKDCNELKLSPKTRLKARRANDRLSADLLKNNQSSIIRTNIKCVIGDKVYNNKPIKTTYEETNDELCITTHINREYLMTCDNVSIIYNFPRYFEWFNHQGYSMLVSNPINQSLFEIIEIQAQDTYPTGMTFRHLNKLAVLQLMSVQNILNNEERSLEDAIKYFYESHLKESYKYPAPKITIPEHGADYVTKLRIMIPEIDAITKHYDTFVENREIDLDLIAFGKPLRAAQCRSLLKTRNVYAASDKTCAIHSVCRLLFSKHSTLNQGIKIGDKHFKKLLDAIIHEKVNYNSLANHQQGGVDFLIEQNILMLDDNKCLFVPNMNHILIYALLWNYQVISYWQCNKDIRSEIDRLIEKGWLESDNDLLSKQEKDWFSFYLDNAKFTNGYAIRNIFTHGANSNLSDEEMQTRYYIVLMLLITLLYKIDLDLKLNINTCVI